MKSQVRPARSANARRLAQLEHKTALQKVYNSVVATTRPWNCRRLDRSRYFPHQSEREINRRKGQK